MLVPGDISDPAHCRAIIQRAVDEFGKLDILVNNAAFQMTHDTLEEISDEEWIKTFTHQHARPVLPDQGGAGSHEARLGDREHELGQLRQGRRPS